MSHMAPLRSPLFRSSLCLLIAVVASGAQRPQHEPEAISATICGIAKNPERYDGKTVRLPAVLATGFEIFALRDPERRCDDIWLATSDSNDPSLKNLAKYSTARLRSKQHPLDYGPPRYAIVATFVGKLQYTHGSGFTVDSKNRVGSIRGRFGHLGLYKTQILLQSVADLHVRDLLGSVYKTSEYEPYASDEKGVSPNQRR
jgi:hypothetical protein